MLVNKEMKNKQKVHCKFIFGMILNCNLMSTFALYRLMLILIDHYWGMLYKLMCPFTKENTKLQCTHVIEVSFYLNAVHVYE